ncbi:hypothetical protein CBM2592_A60065 [Cupriavidus taiwanensis]|nr:hypothetical protein CBM2592_A60065 [Cupriavidus taiwanensis]SOZ82552.1 hypothetical protein CBM2622_A50071 [Cupriavidus taiwanensis]SOZ90997.1 hypothetical protein CBM2621_A50067 [Cupriavidus taiwanensis]SPA29687.1 hypothetical protein CBM2623_A60035 [Cupriavidus taiwanensis]
MGRAEELLVKGSCIHSLSELPASIATHRAIRINGKYVKNSSQYSRAVR